MALVTTTPESARPVRRPSPLRPVTPPRAPDGGGGDEGAVPHDHPHDHGHRHARWRSAAVGLVRRLVVVALVAGAALALGVVLLVPELASMARAVTVEQPDDVLTLAEPPRRSKVYDRQGNVIAVWHAEENRSPIALDRVPAHVVDAVLAVEDDGFYRHQGVDARSMVRALVANVRSGEVRQGGSTITQQVVKNLLLTPEQSIERKAREAVLALRLEQQLSKDGILERYLNTVYFGNGAYGVQAAAERYFGHGAEQLTVAEGAFLAGVIRNPVGYDPLRHPERARQRRDLVLDRMVATGRLAPAEATRLRGEPVPRQLVSPPPPPDAYFVEEVKRRLLDDERIGETPQERYNALFKGGLEIHTTFDRRAHEVAQAAVRHTLPDTGGRFVAALASVEPGTGAVRAVVGGDDFGTEQYNLATQGRRQPGSSFKTVVLLAALEQGYQPRHVVDGRAGCVIRVPGIEPYSPSNYEGSAGGRVTLADATVRSLNCAYARLGVDVGLDRVIDMADRLGIPAQRLRPYPSISLGAAEVTPLEMAAAYAAIANDGVYHAPRFVEKVVDRHGTVLFAGRDEGRRVLTPQTARLAVDVLRQVVERGTGTRARLAGRTVAGKTGTSQNHENAWFVGFTRELSTAVWMGSPEGNVAMSVPPCGRVTGGCFPAMIWQRYMEAALAGVAPSTFAAPDAARIGPLPRRAASAPTTTAPAPSTAAVAPAPSPSPTTTTTATVPAATKRTTTTTTTAPPASTPTTSTSPTTSTTAPASSEPPGQAKKKR